MNSLIPADKFQIRITQIQPKVGEVQVVEPPDDGGGWILVNADAVGDSSNDFVTLLWKREKTQERQGA